MTQPLSSALDNNSVDLNLSFSPRLSFDDACIETRARTYQDLLVHILRGLRLNPDLLDQMKLNPRWEAFFTPSSEQRLPDANQLGHALNTYRIATDYTSADNLPPNLTAADRPMLRIAALVHDLGELGPGDIQYNNKNSQHEKEEHQHFSNNLARYFKNCKADELDIINAIYFEIAHNKDMNEPRAFAFNVIERLGYFAAACEVFSTKPKGINWPRLCANVLMNLGEPFLILSEDVPFVRRTIANHSHTIKAMLEYLDTDIKQLLDPVNKPLWRNLLALIEE